MACLVPSRGKESIGWRVSVVDERGLEALQYTNLTMLTPYSLDYKLAFFILSDAVA